MKLYNFHKHALTSNYIQIADICGRGRTFLASIKVSALFRQRKTLHSFLGPNGISKIAAHSGIREKSELKISP